MTKEENARLANLEKDVSEIKKEVKELRASWNRLDGGRSALLWLFGAAATVIGSIYAAYRMFF